MNLSAARAIDRAPLALSAAHKIAYLECMDERTSFLFEILADPDADMPRLVYADWLEEQGDPRSEFIRVQCELAHPIADDERRTALETRERALLPEVRAACLRQLQGLGVRDFRFGRGFIEKVQIEGTRFLDLSQALFEAAPALRGLMLRTIPQGRGGDTVERLVNSRYFAALTSLDLSNNSIGAAGAKALSRSPRLAGLTSLNLSNNRMGGHPLQDLVSSPYIGRLASLVLCRNDLNPTDVRALARAPRLAALKLLNIDDNQVGDDGLGALAGSPTLAGLESLLAGNNEAAVAGVRALANSPYLSQLSMLNLSHAALGYAGASMLASSSNFSRLTWLDLSYCRLGPDGANALAASLHLKRLTTLNLNGNRIEDGVLGLAASPNLACIKYLGLSDNGITAAGGRALESSPHLSKVTTLDLSRNELGQTGSLQKRFGTCVML